MTLAVVLTAAGALDAQETGSGRPAPALNLPAIPCEPDVIVAEPGAFAGCGCEPATCPPRLTVWGEYLLWWSKGAPLAFPLVTAAPATSTASPPGTLGNPDTVPVFRGQAFPVQSGARFTGDYWLGEDRQLGLEGSYFFLAQSSTQQAVASNGSAGTPNLTNPFFDVAAGIARPYANVLAGPDFIAGGAVLRTTTRLQGAEVNLLGNAWENCNARLVLLTGFRYLRLDEGLTLATTQTDPFLTTFPGQFVNTEDQFSTRNNFYGGQLGARFTVNSGQFFLATTGKVALGSNDATVLVNGFTNTNSGPNFQAPIPTTTVPGGIYAQPTNMGSQHHDRFAVLPEVTIQMGVNLTQQLSVFVGYNFLYLSSVARPGNQIDNTINSTQLTSFTGVPTGPLAGLARPAPLFNTSDFWAQGINFGIQVRW